MQPLSAAIKREPSHYRLAAHKYMLASRRGIITGPKVCTRASTIPKQEAPTNENNDSDATVIVEDNIKPSVPNKRKTTGRNKKTKKQNQVKNICYQNLHPTKRRFCSQTKEKKEETIPVQVFNVCVAMAHL